MRRYSRITWRFLNLIISVLGRDTRGDRQEAMRPAEIGGHKPRDTWSPQKLEDAENGFSPKTPPSSVALLISDF